MRSNGYTEKDLAESYAFLWLENSANVSTTRCFLLVWV